MSLIVAPRLAPIRQPCVELEHARMSDAKPQTRIFRERQARGWSQREAVRNMRAHAADKQLPSEETLLRSWKKWERGDHQPDTFYQPLIARAFGTVTSALFPGEAPRDRGDGLITATGMDTMELVSRMQTSAVDDATLQGLRITADQLCSDYPHMPSAQLQAEGQQWLKRATSLLEQKLTLAQHRELLSIVGLIALLVGCVEYDMGKRRAAEATRRSALSLGTEADDRDVVGWAHEMTAWFCLTQGDYRGAVAAGDRGIAAAGERSVSVQLAAQQAKAWARMGDRRQVELALDRGRALLEHMPYPANRDHHFVVDPSKYDFYVMDCYRRLSEDRLAANYADETLRVGTNFDGTDRSPMRNAEARVTMGVVAARQGDLEQAVTYGQAALEGERKSLPSLLMTTGELREVVERRYPKEPLTRNYISQLQELASGAHS